MSSKTGMAFDPEQVQELASALKALAQASTTVMDGCTTTFAPLKGDEIVGDSEQKEPILEAIKDTEEAFVLVNNKLGRMIKLVDSICEKLGIQVNQNIRTADDAAQAIDAQAKKIKESTGEK